jgi:hypothetical protein
MFPAGRTAGNGFALPPFALTPGDGAGCVDALQKFQGLLHECLPRRETRAHVFDSRGGQRRPLERQSLAPRALQGPGGSIRGLPRLLSEGGGDAEQRRWHAHQSVAAELGAPDGVRRFDETGCVKKGQDAVGVARQDCGPLGQVEHGQGGVGAG